MAADAVVQPVPSLSAMRPAPPVSAAGRAMSGDRSRSRS
jgi:hypothetical protein